MIYDFSRGMGFGDSLIRGMQAGQQMQNNRLVQQQNELKLKQMKDELKRKADMEQANEMMGAAYQAERGNLEPLRAVAAKNPIDFGEGATFEIANMGELLTKDEMGNAVVSNEMRNRYLQETGEQLPADPKQAEEVLSKAIMFTSPNGKRLMSPQQLGRGMGKNYRQFKMQEMAKEKQLTDIINGTKEKQSEIQRLSELDYKAQKGGLTPTEQTEYQVLAGKNGLDKQKATSMLVGGTAPDGTYQEGQFTNDLKQAKQKGFVDPKRANQAYSAQIAAGFEYKDQGKLNTEIATVNTMEKLNQDIQKMRSNAIADGTVNSMVANATKYASKDEFKEMKPEDREKVLKKIVRDSKIGMFVSNYLKQTSGTAVNEQEFDRVLTNLVGGDLDKVNMDTVAQAFDAATTQTRSNVDSTVNAIPEKYVGSILKARQSLNSSDTGVKAPIDNVQGGTKSMKDVAAGVPTEQINQGVETAKSVWNKITSVFSGDKPVKSIEPKEVINTFSQGLSNPETRDKTAKYIRDNWTKFSPAQQKMIKASF